MLIFLLLISSCFLYQILFKIFFIFHLMWINFHHWLNIIHENSSLPFFNLSCSSACNSSTAIKALFSYLASSFFLFYSYQILAFLSFINWVKVALITANVKLSKNHAPINTRGMKNRTERELNVFWSITIISDHPSKVTVVKTARKA